MKTEFRGRIKMCAKDVQDLHGVTRSTADRILQRIREQLNKPAKSIVTIGDYCKVTGADYKEVYNYVNYRIFPAAKT